MPMTSTVSGGKILGNGILVEMFSETGLANTELTSLTLTGINREVYLVQVHFTPAGPATTADVDISLDSVLGSGFDSEINSFTITGPATSGFWAPTVPWPLGSGDALRIVVEAGGAGRIPHILAYTRAFG
jgi:hypothetical protein